jgi:hypothetical protein
MSLENFFVLYPRNNFAGIVTKKLMGHIAKKFRHLNRDLASHVLFVINVSLWRKTIVNLNHAAASGWKYWRVCQSSSGDLVAASLKLVKNHLGIIRKVASHSQSSYSATRLLEKKAKVFIFCGKNACVRRANIITRVMLIKDHKKIKGNDIWISDFLILFGSASFVLGLFDTLRWFWALRKETMSRRLLLGFSGGVY